MIILCVVRQDDVETEAEANEKRNHHQEKLKNVTEDIEEDLDINSDCRNILNDYKDLGPSHEKSPS